MYNLKIEAVKILETLEDNGYEAFFVGNYPLVKQYNIYHQSSKMKAKQIEIITNADINCLQKLFKVTKINDKDYSKSALIELEIKQNLVYFKIYHAAEYYNVITKKTKTVDSIEKILDNFSFLLETIRMDKDSNLYDYSNKKINSFSSIKDKLLLSNGNFREKLLDNPNIILELCYYASNLDFLINESVFKIISNNNSYLKYESIEKITRYFNMILMSKNPFIGLKIIKNTMLDFDYNGIRIFKFLENIADEHLYKLSNFNSSIDIISRWAYLLKTIDNQSEVIDNFKLSYKNKIIWLLKNFDIIDEQDYKMAIYNSKESLRCITESKCDVFLLYEMFDKLTKLHCVLDNSKINICKSFIDTICSRPFFEYQVIYTDDYICELANKEKGEWLENVKTDIIKKIIKCDKHPENDVYLEMLIDSINNI